MKKWTRRAFIGTGVLAGGAAIFGVAIRPGNRASKVSDLLTIEGETLINLWIKIGMDNVITAYVPHAEMGQGVHTTLAMMLADELDADWTKIKIEEAPSHKEYASGGVIRGFVGGDKEFSALMQETMNGIFNSIGKVMNMQLTGGSSSVRFTGKFVMRVVGAAAKEMIKKAAALDWKVPISELETAQSMISHPRSSRTETYAHFAAKAAELKMPVQPKLKDSSEFRIMGTSVKRNDIPSKVTGIAQYGIDVQLPNLKYASIKAAPVFGSKVKSIDQSGLTKKNGFGKVVKLSNAVAFVADNYWASKKGLEQLKLEFEKSENDKVNTEDLFENFENNFSNTDKLKKHYKQGEIEAAFQSSKQTIEATYKVPFLAHAAMEPLNCTIWLQKEKCEVWIGSQNPLGVQNAVAEIVDLNMKQVHVYNQYLGGGFGRKSETDVAEQAAHIAKEVAFPVKLIWSREEDVQQDKYREGSISKFKATLDSSGNLNAWQNSFLFKKHPEEASLLSYDVPNQYIAYADPETHIPWGNWRSVGHSTQGFFIESFIDEIAYAANKNPFDFRLELLKSKPRMQKALQLVAEKSNWVAELSVGSGRGVAIVESFGSIVAEVAEVTVSEEGNIKVEKVTCVADAGFVVHPDAFKAQMESGIIFGLTAALYGEINIENGAVAQSNFHDYQLLRMADSPPIETYIINSGANIGGAGEPSTPGIAPAVCNAIFVATGIRVRELPLKNHDLRREKWKV